MNGTSPSNVEVLMYFPIRTYIYSDYTLSAVSRQNTTSDLHFASEYKSRPIRIYGGPLVKQLESKARIVQDYHMLAEHCDGANRACRVPISKLSTNI